MEKLIHKLKKDVGFRSMAILSVLIITAVITVLIARSTQETRSKASLSPSIIALSPQVLGTKKGHSTEIQILLTTQGRNIMGASMTLKYDPALLSINSFTPNKEFSETVLNSVNPTTGEIKFIILETQDKSHNSQTLSLGTLKLTAKENGITKINVVKSQIVALGTNTQIPLAALPSGTYTISDTTEEEITPPADPNTGKKADLVPLNFALTDKNGKVKNTFTPGEEIYPLITLTNQGTEQTNSSTEGVVTQIYANSPTPVTKGTVSSENIFLRNGLFSPNYTKEYGSTPTHTNTRFFRGQKFFTNTVPGTYTARVFMNYDNNALEANFANNQITTSYTIR